MKVLKFFLNFLGFLLVPFLLVGLFLVIFGLPFLPEWLAEQIGLSPIWGLPFTFVILYGYHRFCEEMDKPVIDRKKLLKDLIEKRNRR